jgi:benzoyl-CoA reductase subunit BamC
MKSIKTIKIDTDKCTGCRSCEVACSAFHADPKYAIANPKRSRIRVWWDEENNLFVPVLAGQYTDAECNARFSMVINGKEYSECILCRASCPSRKLFIEPDADIPLKCDACGTPSPLQGPLCVNVCLAKALTCVERQVDDDE